MENKIFNKIRKAVKDLGRWNDYQKIKIKGKQYARPFYVQRKIRPVPFKSGGIVQEKGPEYIQFNSCSNVYVKQDLECGNQIYVNEADLIPIERFKKLKEKINLPLSNGLVTIKDLLNRI